MAFSNGQLQVVNVPNMISFDCNKCKQDFFPQQKPDGVSACVYCDPKRCHMGCTGLVNRQGQAICKGEGIFFYVKEPDLWSKSR